jgi:hypothetical protein
VGETATEYLQEYGVFSIYAKRHHRKQAQYDLPYMSQWLALEAKETNREKSRVCARVEHVFGQMKMSLAGTFCRTIGIVRAKAHVAFKNIAYNSYDTGLSPFTHNS